MRQKCASLLAYTSLKINYLPQNMGKFESGHPDLKPAPSAGFIKNEMAHFGALDDLSQFGFSSETLTKTCQTMIQSVSIHNAGGDISKRWYVEYRELCPEKLTWKRIREYRGVNRHKDPAMRMAASTEIYTEVCANITRKFSLAQQGSVSIKFHIDAYLADKSNVLRPKSIKNIKASLLLFYKYLCKTGHSTIAISHIRRDHIRDFRIHLSARLGNRSVNNHIDFVKAFFNYYMTNHEDLVLKNPCTGISKLPNTSETHVAYSDDQAVQILEHIYQTDRSLWLFCKFVGVGFVRCEEARTLKIGDIDFKNKTLTVSAGNSKTRRRSVKPIMSLFYNILISEGLHKFPKTDYIFSYGGKPGKKPVHYNHFAKKYHKVKQLFGLSKSYTLYGFRHTTVCKVLSNNANWINVMKYTGHTTMEAFNKYANGVLIKPAEDLSSYL